MNNEENSVAERITSAGTFLTNTFLCGVKEVVMFSSLAGSVAGGAYPFISLLALATKKVDTFVLPIQMGIVVSGCILLCSYSKGLNLYDFIKGVKVMEKTEYRYKETYDDVMIDIRVTKSNKLGVRFGSEISGHMSRM